ncbi:hypothetical protein ACOME3_003290 [Neoechinorhynchus agilis]
MSSQQKVPLDPSTPRGRYPVQDNQANVYSQHSFQLQRYPQTWTPYDFIAVQPHAQPENNAYNNFQGTSLSTSNEYVYRPGYFRMINQSVPNSIEVYPGGYYTERSYVNERFPQRLNYRGNQTNQSRMVHNLQNYYDGESWSSQQPDNFQRIPQFPAINTGINFTRMRVPQGTNYQMAYNPDAAINDVIETDHVVNRNRLYIANQLDLFDATNRIFLTKCISQRTFSIFERRTYELIY